ncbi:MAG: HEPN domain-containing protein [Candidatus Woesearchaeota archaeon]
MINSFESYLKEGKAKKQTPNIDESKSLIQKGKKRLNYTKSKEQNEDNAPFILEDSYESAREAAQSLMAIKGYKPYSHEATISFLNDFYKNEFSEQEIYEFDRYRQLRNNSVYRAEKINIEDAKNCLRFAEKIIEKIERLLKQISY